MFCTKCGKEIKDDAMFCGNCGNCITKKPVPVIVPEPMPQTAVTQETVIVPEIPEASVVPVSEETVVIPDVIIPAIEETVVIPQVTEEPEVSQTPVILPFSEETMVMPPVPEEPITPMAPLIEQQPSEIPEEPVSEPAAPAPKKKKGVLVLVLGLLAALIVVLAACVLGVALIIGALFANNEKTDEQTPITVVTAPSDIHQEGLSAEELRDQLTKFTSNGLNIYLSDDFELADTYDSAACYESDDLQVTVSWGAVAEGIDSSREHAKDYEAIMKSEYDSFQRSKKHGIYYTVATSGVDHTVTGFYVKDGYGWTIQIITSDYEAREAELIDYVTLGEVDSSFQPPVSDVEVVEKKEFSFAGLHLLLPVDIETSAFDEYCVYSNDDIMLLVQIVPLDELVYKTSRDYAENYLDSVMEEGWTTMYVETRDEVFYYALMSDDDDRVNAVGMYTYGDVAWIVMAETVTGVKYSESMVDYITSGRIVPEEIPVIVPDMEVEYKGLTITVPGDFKEYIRSESGLILSNGVLDVTVNKYTESTGTDVDLAQQAYLDALPLWDHVEWDSVGNGSYVATWDDVSNAENYVIGYYVYDGDWWTVTVQGVGVEHLSTMTEIAVSGTIAGVTDTGDLVYRDRISMSGQDWGSFDSLRFQYDPTWHEDDETYSFSGGDFVMVIFEGYLSDLDVSDALELARMEAAYYGDVWNNVEVGYAGGVPYVLLWDHTMDYYRVIGCYTDSTYAWEIHLDVEGEENLDKAIWYATSGIVE